MSRPIPVRTSRIDWPGFGACIVIILGVCLPLIAFPETARTMLQSLYGSLTREFGIFYLVAGIAVVTFLIWLASSHHGRKRLGHTGDTQEPPEFGLPTWAAMLFCAGVGGGLMYWCMTEWAYYYQSPPFGAEARSIEAADWASTYGLFHWGFTAWAFYCLPAVAIAYPYYRNKLDILRFSTSCHWFLRGKEQGPIARTIDVLFMIALIGGAASSLGFSVPMIAACVSWIFDTEPHFGLEIAIVVVCVLLFAGSVWLGLKKGIGRLSDINLILAFGLLLFILIDGPTAFLFKASLNAVGMLAQNYLRISFWSDPFTESGFVEDWTVFYWAWWIAYAPYVGIFVTRISRGRSLREVIVGMLAFGSLGSWVFYMIIGNFALFQQLSGAVNFTSILENAGGNMAIVATLEQLPLASWVIGVFAAVAIIFSATTYDSASYTLASSATLHLHAGEDPARWHRVFWAFALGLMPITLMFIGGLEVLKLTLLLVSLPILLVLIVAAVALVKTLRAAT